MLLNNPTLLPTRRAGQVLQSPKTRLARSHRAPTVLTEAKLVLVPTGDGSCEHLGRCGKPFSTNGSSLYHLMLIPNNNNWGCAVETKSSPNGSPVYHLMLIPTTTGEPVALPPTLELPESGTVELGRDEPADLLVPVPTVSGRHALIKVEGDKVTVTDLNSTNGTFLNGEQLNPMQAVAVETGAEVGSAW